MNNKPLKYDGCVIAQHNIKRHEIVVINDLPLNGMMVTLLSTLLTFDKPINLVSQYLSGGIEFILGWRELHGNHPFENDMAIIALQHLSEMVMYHDKLKRKEEIEIDPESDNPVLY